MGKLGNTNWKYFLVLKKAKQKLASWKVIDKNEFSQNWVGKYLHAEEIQKCKDHSHNHSSRSYTAKKNLRVFFWEKKYCSRLLHLTK